MSKVVDPAVCGFWPIAMLLLIARKIQASCSIGGGWRPLASAPGRNEGQGAPRSLKPRPLSSSIQIGYSLPDPDDDKSTVRRLAAFQRRYRPELVDGGLDRQTLCSP